MGDFTQMHIKVLFGSRLLIVPICIQTRLNEVVEAIIFTFLTVKYFGVVPTQVLQELLRIMAENLKNLVLNVSNESSNHWSHRLWQSLGGATTC